jgi:hypothetical protein
MIPARLVTATLALVALAGCGSDPAAILERDKVSVSGEQVAITPDQVLCGEKEGLWKIEQQSRGAVGALTPAGRALGFADDVIMGDTRFRDPYAMVTGDRQLKVTKVTQAVDDDPTTKTVTASIRIVMKHSCFDKPLPMHGAQYGAFSQDVDVRVRLKNGAVDRILH